MIPLEKIDLIHPPQDPRSIKRDEWGDEDAERELLPLPRFWRETVLKAAREKNEERNGYLNGSFKRSTSYVRECFIQNCQRLSMTSNRKDPRLERLERSLFEPPRKVENKSPKKDLNQSQPNIKSTFDEDNLDGVSSDSSSFSSAESSAESFGSLPDFDEKKGNVPNGASKDSDSDDDNTFAAFNQKRKARANSKPAAKRVKPNSKPTAVAKKKEETKKAPTTTMSLRNRRSAPVKNESECFLATLSILKLCKCQGVKQIEIVCILFAEFDLYGTPPRVDKNAILDALTDTSDGEFKMKYI